jgi:glycosyltransferase involved in cell wall biosynthesis
MSAPLRIGVDARELVGDKTGVGRYLGELLRRWLGRADAASRRFILYTPKRLDLRLPPHAAEIRLLPARFGRGTLWEQTQLRRAAAEDNLDLFFAPAYTAPVGLTMPLAVTIHDISFEAHPEWFRPRERLRRRWLTRHVAQCAAVVLTDSEFSRSEIETRLRIDSSRIVVIPPGVTDRGSTPRTRSGRDASVLYVGSIFNRRRLPDLIAAFARATADMPYARLIVVGDNRTWPKQDLAAIAAQYGVKSRIDFRRYAAEHELADLYNRASVFAFLSEYEGFGMTPLEALSAGVPPIVLDTAVAREVYGDAAFFVPPGAIEQTATLLRRLLVDPASALPLLLSAKSVLRRYSWDTAAERTLEQLERVARR